MSALEELYQEVANCTACILHQSRTRTVPGEGPERVEILFIGEGPGYHEDQQGRPFVGPSGRLLEKWLALIGLTREQVYIANVVKCRPPSNRDPLPAEVEMCRPFLERQIELLDPRLIATLGRYSMERYFPGARISQVHGRARRDSSRVYIPLYHPAYILRNGSAAPAAEADFEKIPRLLARLYEVLAEETRTGPPEAPSETAPLPEASLPAEESPKQLRMF
jgi:uracil-DNA glycosylase family 4